MLLTFRVKLLKVIDGTKLTTIRIMTKHREAYWDRHCTPDNLRLYNNRKRIVNTWREVAHLWWLNPRNRNPYCRKIGKAPLIDIQRTEGRHLNLWDAQKDGFETLNELIETLAKTNNTTQQEVLNAVWLIYTWDNYNLALEPQMYPHNVKTCKEGNCPVCKETPKEDVI